MTGPKLEHLRLPDCPLGDALGVALGDAAGRWHCPDIPAAGIEEDDEEIAAEELQMLTALLASDPATAAD